MRAPTFWWRGKPTLTAILLWPVGWAYGEVTARRMSRKGVASKSQKVICIGNFTAGGAGKTPVAIAVAKALQHNSRSVCFLSRGYGGNALTPMLVDPLKHSAALVGDEPLLLGRIAPTIIAKNRADGLELCAATVADIIIMDDGLQNSSLQKNITIAVVDAQTGTGNGLCVPAGPLRAPLDIQLKYVDIVVFLGDNEQSALKSKLEKLFIPYFLAQLEAPSHTLSSLRGKALLAYCGIGRPDKFFNTVEKIGGHVAKKRSFPDHHNFTENDAKALLEDAQKNHLTLITTEKDFARLPKDESYAGILAARSRVLPVEAVFNQPQEFISLLL